RHSRGGFRYVGQRLPGEAFFNEAGQELRERLDILSDACRLERGEIRLAQCDRYHRPGISAGRHHDIHQEAADPPVAVKVRMDVDEHEVPEDHAHRRVGLVAHQIEESRHGIQDRIAVHWYVLGFTDVGSHT